MLSPSTVRRYSASVLGRASNALLLLPTPQTRPRGVRTVKNPVRSVARNAVQARAWKHTSEWIRGTELWNQLEDEFDGRYVKAEVVVYFGDRGPKFYQLAQ